MAWDFLGIRRELKSRVDEILSAGNEWNKTARELTEALNRLTDSIKKGNPNRADIKSVAQTSRKLAKETGRLTRVFEAEGVILGKILNKV